MSLILEKHAIRKQERDHNRHENCIFLTNYMKNIIDHQYEKNEYIDNDKAYFHTECLELQTFIKETNKSRNNKMFIEVPHTLVNYIKTDVESSKNKVIFRLCQK